MSSQSSVAGSKQYTGTNNLTLSVPRSPTRQAIITYDRQLHAVTNASYPQGISRPVDQNFRKMTTPNTPSHFSPSTHQDPKCTVTESISEHDVHSDLSDHLVMDSLSQCQGHTRSSADCLRTNNFVEAQGSSSAPLPTRAKIQRGATLQEREHHESHQTHPSTVTKRSYVQQSVTGPLPWILYRAKSPSGSHLHRITFSC